MRFSSRLPADLSPNRLARLLAEKRTAGAELLDLTETNPTRVGLPGAPPEAWRRFTEGAAAGYEPEPLGPAAAREAVAAYHAECGFALPPEHVALTSGTSESYAHLFRVFAEPGDAFLVPEPSYPLFGPLAELEGVRPVAYPLRYRAGRWHLDRDALEDALDGRTRGVIVVEPNNPTGSLLDAHEARALDALGAERGLVLVSDRVFGDFVEASGEHRAAGPAAALTVVLSGLSKVCGVPQVKCAWMALSGPEHLVAEAMPRLEWACDAFLSVGSAVQAALPAFLAGRHGFQEAVRARLRRNLAVLDGALAASGAERLAREGGWSAVVRLPPGRAEEEWAAAFLERGVVIHPGHFFDFAEEPYAVVSLLPEPAVFARAAERLGSALERGD